MKTNDIIIDKSEKLVFSLKNGNLQNVLSGEGIKEETAIITDKRMYYSNKVGIINIVSRDEKVDLPDITGTKIAERNPIGVLIIGILLAVIAAVVFIASEQPVIGIIAGVAVLLITILLYVSLHKKYLIIEYAGGKIQFSLIGYKKENIVGFQNAIYVEKEKIINARCNPKTSEEKPEQSEQPKQPAENTI